MQIWAFEPNADSYTILHYKLSATGSEKPDLVWLQMTDEVPAGFAKAPKLAVPELIKTVDARAAGRAASDQFSGAVLIAQHGRVLFEKAYGLADRSRGKPNTPDTQFRFGSMGKMFTAVAIMQLVQDGKIDPAAPIGRYLPDYPNQDMATKVTVANLLTHTGGTGDIFGPLSDADRKSLRTPADYVALFGRRAPEFAPGSRFSYSNYGFMLLGRIVETVSGLGYDDYIQRHIFGPAGMASTGNRPESDVLPRRAVSYTGYGATLRAAVDMLPYSGTPAGGGYATVGDFNRFVDGLTTHKLLRVDTLQKLIDGGVTMSDGKFAGYDFGGSIAGNGRFIGHGGGAPGMNGMLYHFLDSGFTIAVLANRDPMAADAIAIFAVHRLPGK
jgi:CubicO group peptidase (beta-lactamase class C family)